MPPAPKKPTFKKKLTPGHHIRPIEQETAGKLYLVRDKDYGDGQPVLWGFDLRYPEAQKLKEQVAAKRLSTTVRFEEQTDETVGYLGLAVDPRSPWTRPASNGVLSAPPVTVTTGAAVSTPDVVFSDPAIVAARGIAMGAVSGIVADANRRQAELKAQKTAQGEAMKPPPMPEIPSEEELAKMIADGDIPEGLDADELEKLMGGETDADDVAAAAARNEGDLPPAFNALEEAKKWPCTHVGCGAMPHMPCVDPAGPITHPERIQAAIAAGPVGAVDVDAQLEAGHA